MAKAMAATWAAEETPISAEPGKLTVEEAVAEVFLPSLPRRRFPLASPG